MNIKHRERSIKVLNISCELTKQFFKNILQIFNDHWRQCAWVITGNTLDFRLEVLKHPVRNYSDSWPLVDSLLTFCWECPYGHLCMIHEQLAVARKQKVHRYSMTIVNPMVNNRVNHRVNHTVNVRNCLPLSRGSI